MRQEAWDALAQAVELVAPQRPDVGKRVEVTSGKHKGRTGVVTWHGVSKFDRGAFRYGDDMVLRLREARGTRGYRCRVQTDDHDSFFVAADAVSVIP